jgi:hypothetical protein
MVVTTVPVGAQGALEPDPFIHDRSIWRRDGELNEAARP